MKNMEAWSKRFIHLEKFAFWILLSLTVLIFTTIFVWLLTWSNAVLELCLWIRDLGVYAAIGMCFLLLIKHYFELNERRIQNVVVIIFYGASWIVTECFMAYAAAAT